MSNWKLLSGVAAASMMTAAIVAPVEAQVTSSSINGQIVDTTGAPVSGATVTVLNTRTGQTKTAMTSANGVFFASGLQVGGPYTISASTSSQSGERGDIFLQPSSNSLVIAIAEEARQLETVVVVGSTGTGLDIDTGVGSAFSAEDILNQPSPNRDLIATLVRDPLAFSSGEG